MGFPFLAVVLEAKWPKITKFHNKHLDDTARQSGFYMHTLHGPVVLYHSQLNPASPMFPTNKWNGSRPKLNYIVERTLCTYFPMCTMIIF